MKKLFLIVAAMAISCVHIPVKDPAAAPIDLGQKRVETEICDQWGVGLNGCVFPEGKLSGELKIFKVYNGEVMLTGCGIQKSFKYGIKDDPWLRLQLTELLGTERIESDCIISIYQKIEFPKSDKVPFPIRGMTGDVVLGTCPINTQCSHQAKQYTWGSEAVWKLDPDELPGDVENAKILIRGCGKDILGPQDFDTPLTLKLAEITPSENISEGIGGCIFISAIRTETQKFKNYYHAWGHKQVALLAAPRVSKHGSWQYFEADNVISLSYAGKPIFSYRGDFKPSEKGDILRFYTTQGRSLVIFVRDGVIEWML